MAKKKVEAEQEQQSQELKRVEVVHDRTTINGHELKAGTVVELTPEQIEQHRRHGVPLEDVMDNDQREVKDVQTPFESPDTEEAK